MSSLRLLALPVSTRLLLTWQLTSDQDLRRIRAGVERFFAAQPGAVEHEDLAQRIGLVATELAGNALRHGLPPITVRLLCDEDCYILDVSDKNLDQTPEPTVVLGRTRAGGRGLHIASSLAQEVCWYTNGDTKHVWASFPLRPPRPRPPDREDL